jgi:hypothetical protein
MRAATAACVAGPKNFEIGIPGGGAQRLLHGIDNDEQAARINTAAPVSICQLQVIAHVTR